MVWCWCFLRLRLFHLEKSKQKATLFFPFKYCSLLVYIAKQTKPLMVEMIKITGRWPWPYSLITSLVGGWGPCQAISLLQPSNTHTTPLNSEVDGHLARGIRVPTHSTADLGCHKPSNPPANRLLTPSTLGPTAMDSCSKACTQQLPDTALEICRCNSLP